MASMVATTRTPLPSSVGSRDTPKSSRQDKTRGDNDSFALFFIHDKLCKKSAFIIDHYYCKRKQFNNYLFIIASRCFYFHFSIISFSQVSCLLIFLKNKQQFKISILSRQRRSSKLYVSLFVRTSELRCLGTAETGTPAFIFAIR